MGIYWVKSIYASALVPSVRLKTGIVELEYWSMQHSKWHSAARPDVSSWSSKVEISHFMLLLQRLFPKKQTWSAMTWHQRRWFHRSSVAAKTKWRSHCSPIAARAVTWVGQRETVCWPSLNSPETVLKCISQKLQKQLCKRKFPCSFSCCVSTTFATVLNVKQLRNTAKVTWKVCRPNLFLINREQTYRLNPDLPRG